MDGFFAWTCGPFRTRHKVEHFLKELFANGKPIASTEIYEIAREHKIAERTLKRAAKDIGIKVRRDGPPNANGAPTWRWHPLAFAARPVLDSVRADQIESSAGG